VAGRQIEITSRTNDRIRQLVNLRRRRTREHGGLTLVDGREELELALAAGVRPHALYYCPQLAGPAAAALADQVAALGGEVIQVSPLVFEKVAYRESPDGYLAVVPSPGTDLGALVPGRLPLIVVCQHVEKPGNLGAILRTADAAGVTAVIAADPVTDWGNPNVVRASKGTVFSVPVAATTAEQVLAWLAQHRIALVATTPQAEAVPSQVDLTGPVAIAVGAEKHGLPDAWLAASATRVRIPMIGLANSLNVATAAAILVYEAVRQRMLASGGPPR
jgi:TrmH family RNA methyltransferase